MIRWLLIFLAVLFTGCTQTETTRQSDVNKTDKFTMSGSVVLPVPGGGSAVVPIELTATRSGNESLTEHSESKTKIDAEAIAQQVSAVVSKTVQAAISSATSGLLGGGGWDSTKTTLASGAAAAAAYALREMLNARAAKKDADEGWSEAMKLAKKSPPDTSA